MLCNRWGRGRTSSVSESEKGARINDAGGGDDTLDRRGFVTTTIQQRKELEIEMMPQKMKTVGKRKGVVYVTGREGECECAKAQVENGMGC